MIGAALAADLERLETANIPVDVVFEQGASGAGALAMIARLFCGAMLLVSFAAHAASPAWVEKSNEHAQVLIGRWPPSRPSSLRASASRNTTTRSSTSGPISSRAARQRSKVRRSNWKNAPPPKPIRWSGRTSTLMIDSTHRQLDSVDMEDRFNLAYTDAPRLVFNGVQRLTDPQLPGGTPREGDRTPARLRRPRAGHASRSRSSRRRASPRASRNASGDPPHGPDEGRGRAGAGEHGDLRRRA